MQTVYTRTNQTGNQLVNTAATVHLVLQAVGMSQIAQSLHVRRHEPVEQFRAHEGTGLAAKIIAHKEYVNHIACSIEGPLADFEIIVHKVLEDRIHHVRLGVHLDVEIFHTHQVDGIVPERRPIAPQNGKLAVMGLSCRSYA